MSDAPSVEGILLQFVYMCMHHVTGYFRRRDGHPLDVSTMQDPYGADLIGEQFNPFDPAVHPPVQCQIRPVMRLCRLCTQARAQDIDRIRRTHQQNPQLGPWVERLTLEQAWTNNRRQDVNFMVRALGDNILGVRERMERRVIEGPSPAEETDNANDNNDGHDSHDSHDNPDNPDSHDNNENNDNDNNEEEQGQ